MTATPNLRIERSPQLDPGDLFVFNDHGNSCVAFLCDYRDPNPTKLVAPLGPNFPRGETGPRLLDMMVMGVSFGKNFIIELPISGKFWTEREPSPDVNCLLVTSAGVYFRVNGNSPMIPGFMPCYIDAATGLVQVSQTLQQGNYVKPTGMGAFALAWEITTTEAKPRSILKYPYDSSP